VGSTTATLGAAQPETAIAKARRGNTFRMAGVLSLGWDMRGEIPSETHIIHNTAPDYWLLHFLAIERTIKGDERVIPPCQGNKYCSMLFLSKLTMSAGTAEGNGAKPREAMPLCTIGFSPSTSIGFSVSVASFRRAISSPPFHLLCQKPKELKGCLFVALLKAFCYLRYSI
jgi:hypothetical protein